MSAPFERHPNDPQSHNPSNPASRAPNEPSAAGIFEVAPPPVEKVAQTLPISPQHVALQRARRKYGLDSQFLTGEVASRLAELLLPMRLEKVQQVLDFGCGLGAEIPRLQAQFPQATLHAVDPSQAPIETVQKQYGAGSRLGSALGRLLRREKAVQTHCAPLENTAIAPQSMDVLWSNMTLYLCPDAPAIFREWRRLVRPDGLVLFSTLGPGTFQPLMRRLQAAGLVEGVMPFTDMHDLGDMLVHQDFENPVMQQENLTLVYETPARYLQDLRILGGNAALNRAPGGRSRDWYQRLLAEIEKLRTPDGLLPLTLELVYGHAWRSHHTTLASGEQTISLKMLHHRRQHGMD